MIHIGEILDPACIFADLSPGTKSEVLGELTARLAQIGRIDDAARLHRLLVEREELMTTGVRRGFAFPHAFSPGIKHSFLSLGVVAEGIDFDSLDGQPVNFVFLLLGPPDNQAMHLRILARISRLTGQSDVFQLMRAAKTPEDLLEVIRDSEHQLKANPYVVPDLRE